MQKPKIGDINGSFFFDPKDLIYQDHFPGNPVVPGSLIVHAFITAMKQAGFKSKSFAAKKFRFKEFVSPGNYQFSIKAMDNQLKCRLLYKDNIMATGIIQFS